MTTTIATRCTGRVPSQSRLAAALLSTLTLTASACYQGRYDAIPGADDDPASNDGDPADTSGADDDNAQDLDIECGPHSSPLRRLTRTQYINTVQALFPGRDLSEVASVMPADATAHGFENAAAMQVPSPALIEGYQRAALAITRSVFADTPTTAQTLGQPIPAAREDALALGRATIEAYGPRMFRRPMTDDERERYVELFEGSFEDTGNLDDDFIVALAVAVQAMMQAPAFLYIIEHGEGEAQAEPGEVIPLTSWELASRLSYLLWDSMPDDVLLAAAEDDALRTPEQIKAQVRRMLEAEPARAAVRGFHRQWLRFDDLLDETKDAATHPQWSQDLLDAAYEQLGRFVEASIFDGEGTVAALLTSHEFPVDARLASLLGVSVSGEGWETIALPPEQRRGVLTLPGILAAQAHPVDPSPVLRGVFIRDRILCAPLPPPPDEVDAIPPADDPSEPKTNRDRYEQHSTDPECAGCHSLIDGIGFPFEHYDAIGAFRTEDRGFPIDASGELVAAGDADGAVDGPMELVDRLAGSTTVQHCVATQWFRYAFARDAEADGPDTCTTDDLQTALAESGGDIRELLVQIALSDGFRQRRIPID